MFTSFLFMLAMFACCSAWGNPLPPIELLNSEDSRWEFVTVSRDGYSLYRRPNKAASVLAVLKPDGDLSYLNTLYPDGGGVTILGTPKGSVLRTPDVVPLSDLYCSYIKRRQKQEIEERYVKGDAQYEKEEAERRRVDNYVVGWEKLPELGSGIVATFEYHGERVVLTPGGGCFVYPEEASVKEGKEKRGLTPWETDAYPKRLNEKVSSASGSLINRAKDGKDNLADREQYALGSEPAPLTDESSENRVSYDIAQRLPKKRLSQKGSLSSIHYSENNNLADREQYALGSESSLWIDCGLLLTIERLKEIEREIREEFSL